MVYCVRMLSKMSAISGPVLSRGQDAIPPSIANNFRAMERILDTDCMRRLYLALNGS